MILCSVALDGVLGGVMGSVCCIVFWNIVKFSGFHMRWNVGYDN